MMSRTASWLLALCLAGVAGTAAAEQEILFNRVYLEAQAEGRVANEEMEVLMLSQHEGKSPQAISDSVDADMKWALAEAKQYADVEAATQAYQTQPIYDQRVIAGWRAAQELRLSGRSTAKLTELVGKLQQKLQVSQMRFLPTRKALDQRQDELIEEALASFHRRAAIVGRQMDGKQYRLVEVHVSTGGGFQPVMYAERAMMKSADAAMAPSVEAGETVVTVTVSGNVQFY